jgi:hypothetical protein
MTNASVTYSRPSTPSTSVQKRRTLYLAKSDPRANQGFVTKYRNDYYGEVVILEDDAYLAMLATQGGISFSEDLGDAKSLNASGSQTAASLVDSGTVLHPPTLLYWDYQNDATATEFINATGKNQVNVKVTFDSVDSTIDGVEYEYYVSTSKTNPQTGSSAATSLQPIDPTTVHFSHYYSGMIEAIWTGFTDAIGYTVIIQGVNCNYRAESQKSATGNTGSTPKKRIYYLNYDPTHPSTSFPSPGYLELNASGKATIKVLPLPGKTFSGNYTVYFIANYTNGTADIKKSPKATFTIGGGAPVIV